MTENQEKIYNLYLSSTRRKQNLPYKKRMDFSGFEEEYPEVYASILKIEKLFNFIPSLNKTLYFEAPYILHKDQGHTEISFYATQKAVKDYSTCLNHLNTTDADDEQTLKYIVDSFNFIFHVCEINKMTLKEFFVRKAPVYTFWMIGFQSKKISKYVLFGMADYGVPILDLIYSIVAPDELEFVFGDFLSNYIQSKQKFDHSSKAKELVFKGLKLLEEKTKNFKNEVETSQTV